MTELRSELGKETLVQRQMPKTAGGNYSRADIVERTIQWMHASGATTYDGHQYHADETRTAPQ
ncbi:hypothetical protein [Amycolatopsis sp. NPDC004079]|uniref:hypothetical protein n=1 Tax=Amycolatopsis sp. NPDC004079 TaxID=3154549 RepID=UPI0033BF2445